MNYTATEGKTMKKMRLHVAYDYTLEELLFTWGEMFPNVYVRLVEKSGPMGGWPVVEVAGKESDLRGMLTELGYETDDVEDEMATAVKI